MPSRNCAGWSRIWIRRGRPARRRGTPPLLDRHQLRLCTSRSPRIPAGVSHLGPRPSPPASPPPSSQQPAGSTPPPVPAHQEAAGCGTPPLHHPDHSHQRGQGEVLDSSITLITVIQRGQGEVPDCSVTLITTTQMGQGGCQTAPSPWSQSPNGGRVQYLTAPSPWSQSPRGTGWGTWRLRHPDHNHPEGYHPLKLYLTAPSPWSWSPRADCVWCLTLITW